ncbi:MAG: hypothetical protein LIO46_00405 [Clostridiales bacterium]|nr:hypothetical protein [Clostridiales bacterium]
MHKQTRLELILDAVYLTVILSLGIWMLADTRDNGYRLWFGSMALVLGIGSLFYLLPRMFELAGQPFPLWKSGTGRLLASIAATIYYMILHCAWYSWAAVGSLVLTCVLVILALLHIALCFLPQNDWNGDGGGFGIRLVRNLPFFLMEILTAVSFLMGEGSESALRWIPLAVLISFACYLPAALWSGKYPALNSLMMPRHVCYLWIQVMGLQAAGLL